MMKSIGVQLIVYGVLLGALGYLVDYLASAWGRPSLIAGIAGGALCVIWGLRAAFWGKGKALAILTLIALNFVLLSQALVGWSRQSEGAQGGRSAAMVVTGMLLLSLWMLVRIAWSGVVFDVPAKDRQQGPKSDTARKS